jgi:hypothetical protein
VIDGVSGTEIRVVDQVAYVKAPVGELAAKFGASKADIDSMRKETSSAAEGIDTLFNGGWVAIGLTDLTKLSEGATNVAPSADPAQAERAAAELKTSAENLLDGADVVRDDKDKTHLIVTTSTVKAYEQGKRLAQAMEKIGGKAASGMLDGALSSELDKPPADKPIVLDLWIDKGAFRAFEINLMQFADGGTGRATLRVEVATGAAIAAPDGAKKIDVTKLFESLGGPSGVGIGAPSPGGIGAPRAATGGAPSGASAEDAAAWAEMIGSQAILFAVADGGTPAAHLKDAAAKMTLPGVTVKVVRSGVAQVTMGKNVACVTVPGSAEGKPKVVARAC